MYYLVDVDVYKTYSVDSHVENQHMSRLVKAESKNSAWEKTKHFLEDVYITKQLGIVTKYNINVRDTID